MEHNRKRDQDPNRAANEPAEGSREIVRDNKREKKTGGSGESGGGITNRDLQREHTEQEHLPPRGGTREDR